MNITEQVWKSPNKGSSIKMKDINPYLFEMYRQKKFVKCQKRKESFWEIFDAEAIIGITAFCLPAVLFLIAITILGAVGWIYKLFQ